MKHAATDFLSMRLHVCHINFATCTQRIRFSGSFNVTKHPASLLTWQQSGTLSIIPERTRLTWVLFIPHPVQLFYPLTSIDSTEWKKRISFYSWTSYLGVFISGTKLGQRINMAFMIIYQAVGTLKSDSTFFPMTICLLKMSLLACQMVFFFV